MTSTVIPPLTERFATAREILGQTAIWRQHAATLDGWRREQLQERLLPLLD